MPTYYRAGKYGPALVPGAPSGARLRVVDANGSDAQLWTDEAKNKLTSPYLTPADNGTVSFFADPGTYTVKWSGGQTSVVVTGGVADPSTGSPTNASFTTVLAPVNGTSRVAYNLTGPITVTAVKARRTGGTGATVNASIGGNALSAVDLSLPTENTWTTIPALQNVAGAANADLVVSVVTVVGSVSLVQFQVEYTA